MNANISDDPILGTPRAGDRPHRLLAVWASGGRKQDGGPGDRGSGASSPASAVVPSDSAVLESKKGRRRNPNRARPLGCRVARETAF